MKVFLLLLCVCAEEWGCVWESCEGRSVQQRHTASTAAPASSVLHPKLLSVDVRQIIQLQYQQRQRASGHCLSQRLAQAVPAAALWDPGVLSELVPQPQEWWRTTAQDSLHKVRGHNTTEVTTENKIIQTELILGKYESNQPPQDCQLSRIQHNWHCSCVLVETGLTRLPWKNELGRTRELYPSIIHPSILVIHTDQASPFGKHLIHGLFAKLNHNRVKLFVRVYTLKRF